MKAKKSTKKTSDVKSETLSEAPPQTNYQQEYLILGHLVKYNLYLLAKSIIFSSVCDKFSDMSLAAEETNKIINELDLDTKKRKSESEDTTQN